MDNNARIIAHTGAKAVTELLVSAVETDAVALFETGLIEQIFGSAEVIKLRGGHINTQLCAERCVKTARAAFFGEYLDDAVCSIGTVESGRRAPRYVLYMIDILERNIADRARRGRFTHRHVAQSVRICTVSVFGIVKDGARVEVVNPYAIYVDDGRRIRESRRQPAGFNDGCCSRLPARKCDLYVRECRLQHLIDTIRRHLLQFLGRNLCDVR